MNILLVIPLLVVGIFTIAAGLVVGVARATVWAVGCFTSPLVAVGLSLFGHLEEEPEVLSSPDHVLGPGVPDYLHQVIYHDVRLVRRNMVRLAERRADAWSRMWYELGDFRIHTGETGVNWSVLFLRSRGIGDLGGATVGAVVVVVLAAVALAVAVTLSAAWWSVGWVLRRLDSTLLRIRNAKMFCTTCFRQMPYPAYHCPRCRESHWDIRPGSLGVFRRTCLCGERLPTLMVLGASALDAHCFVPNCAAELPHRPGVVRTVVLPMFGATNAGKTRLIYALVVALQRRAEARGVAVLPGDPRSATMIDGLDERLGVDSPIEPTRIALESALVLHIKPRRRAGGLHLHFFNVAGERFMSQQLTEEHDYVREGQGFTMVIDPLALPGVRSSLPQEERENLVPDAASARTPSPVDVFHQAVEGIKAAGGDPGRARLAIVLSRADKLDLGGCLESWADEVGLGPLLFAAHDTFRRGVRLFSVASIVEDGKLDRSIDPLLSYLLPGVLPGPEKVDK